MYEIRNYDSNIYVWVMFGLVSGSPDITLLSSNPSKGTPSEIVELATKINNACTESTGNSESTVQLEIKKTNNQIIAVTIRFKNSQVTSINATYQNDGRAQNNITPADLDIVKENLKEVANKLFNPLKRTLIEKAKYINQPAQSTAAGGRRVIPDTRGTRA